MLLNEAVERAREVTRSVVASESDSVDREGRWPETALRALQKAGLAGLVLPRAVGGLELGMVGLARVCEEVGRVCPSTALCFGMHHVAAAVLAAKATPEQALRLLEPIARGEHLTTLALSEPGTGVHFYYPETLIERVSGDAFRVRGKKSFVTNGSRADSYVVSTVAVSAAAAPVGEFSCVVIPADAPGLEWGPPWAGLGMRGNSSRNLELRDVSVSRRDLLGEEGDQIWFIFNVVAPFFLMAMAGTYVGLAAAALEEARVHVGQRRHSHSGTTLAQSAIVQHRIGELWANVARTRALIRAAAAAGDAGDPEALPALCSAKAEVAECAVTVVNEVMSLLGGKGYASGSRLDRMLRDARAAQVMAPTTDLLRMWTGRAFLDLPLLTE